MRESEIEKYLVQQVTLAGGLSRKVQWIGHVGAPDRLVLFPARLVWVELKATGQKPRTSQLREHARMRLMGQRVEIIDSKEQIDRLMSEFL